MRTAVLNDVHYPYQCDKAIGLTLKILPALAVDRILLNGDILDFEPLSRFVTRPHRRLDLKPQIETARKELKKIRLVVPNAAIHFKPGNHEQRLQTYLFTKAPELHELEALTLAELLKCKELDIEMKEWGQDYKLGKLNVIHGDEIKVSSVYPARNLYLKTSSNILCGHHHRLDTYLHRSYDQEVRGVFCNGCLCRLDPDWMILPQWQQSISIVDVSKSGLFHVEQLLYMRRGSKLVTFVNGELFEV